MSARVEVDRARCQSSGLCEAIAPNVFRLGQDGAEIIEGDDLNEQAEDVLEAIESCPMEAIRASSWPAR